jgi:hypothetical protein
LAFAEIPAFVGRCLLVFGAYLLACWLGLAM